MRKKPYQKKLYYFPEKLKRQLALIPYYPVTIVEAPSGFGKTTAIKEFLKETRMKEQETMEYWYTCLGEPAAEAWHNICGLIARVDETAASRLKGMEMPSKGTLPGPADLWKDSECLRETYLVIDNYQLVNRGVRRGLINAFSMHGCPALHFIFITQHLDRKAQMAFHNSNIHFIGMGAFVFERDCISRLFELEGIPLSGEETDILYAKTEGWVSAIRLHMSSYRETGVFLRAAGMERLVEIAVWNRLSSKDKEFLTSVSVMDSFTTRQAAIMIGKEVLPDHLKRLLDTNDFIRYFPDQHSYTIHNVLQDYLRNRFYNHRPESFQRRILRLAGQSYAANSQLYDAARCFLKAGDYDAVLSLPFDGAYLASQKENGLVEFLLEIINVCPGNTLCRHPFILLLFAYVLLFEGQAEAFQRISGLLAGMIDNGSQERNLTDNGLPELTLQERKRLRGEYTLLVTFLEYRDINRMNTGIKAARRLLDGPSCMIQKDISCTFGGVSILYLFWREAGKLEETIHAVEEGLPCYLELTQGHGTGADSALRAEALLMRGKDAPAEMLCYKAIYEARNQQQISVCICAELTLARIAILRGDVKGYGDAVANIRGYAQKYNSLSIRRMVELCQGVLCLTLGTWDRSLDWMKDLECIKRIVYAPAVPYVQIIYSYLLLKGKRYGELSGAANLLLQTAGEKSYLLSKVDQLLILAAANHSNGKDGEAIRYLKQAFAAALPDQIYLPFALLWEEHSDLLGAALGCEHQNLAAVCKRQAKGADEIRRAMLKAKSPLTPREREIARFAKNRLSSKEIADKLYISENTVRTTLRNIYFKLEIHSKAELSQKEF